MEGTPGYHLLRRSGVPVVPGWALVGTLQSVSHRYYVTSNNDVKLIYRD
jgi:hypothetical protein